jgi:hypothetical protein
VGFGGRKPPSLINVQSEGLIKAQAGPDTIIPTELMKENAQNEFVTYASGRQNVAFVDLKLTLIKRYNPLVVLGEYIIGFFFESQPAPEERMECTAYAFDGRENLIVPGTRGEERKSTHNSTYDGFVWAVVNKDIMKRLRDDRYDLSLTTTKDHPKLPAWATVMSEANEITETLLTPDLIKAVHAAGDDAFEGLIITDQPQDRPNKYVHFEAHNFCADIFLESTRQSPKSALLYLFAFHLTTPKLCQSSSLSSVSQIPLSPTAVSAPKSCAKFAPLATKRSVNSRKLTRTKRPKSVRLLRTKRRGMRERLC